MADPVTADVQRELAEALATHRLTTPRQCACGERAPYDGGSEYDPEWHSKHVAPTVQALIADAEKRAAAGALRDAALGAAVVHPDEGWCVPTYTLNDRADALDPS